MYFHNVFSGNFNFTLCIGYLAKLGGHLLLRDEIEVMLEGKFEVIMKSLCIGLNNFTICDSIYI